MVEELTVVKEPAQLFKEMPASFVLNDIIIPILTLYTDVVDIVSH